MNACDDQCRNDKRFAFPASGENVFSRASNLACCAIRKHKCILEDLQKKTVAAPGLQLKSGATTYQALYPGRSSQKNAKSKTPGSRDTSPQNYPAAQFCLSIIKVR